MATTFSHSLNDRKAVAIAQKIGRFFPPGSFDNKAIMEFVEYLSKVGKLTYAEATGLLSALQPLDDSPFSVLRVSYALLHYTGESNGMKFGVKSNIKAHAKILGVSVDDITAKHPKLTLKFLLVSSPYAGRIFLYTAGLQDMVKIHKSIYTGRSRALAGRSLREFAGCVCTVKIFDNLVVNVSAEASEKKQNKELCQDRAKKEGECPFSKTCAGCKKRRTECRLAVL